MPANPGTVNTRPSLITLAEAADYAGVHVKTIRRKIAAGHLTAYRMAGGRSLRVKADDLDALFSVVPTVVA